MSGFNVTYTAGGRFDPPFFPTKTWPYVEGNRLPIPDKTGLHVLKYEVTEEMEFMSVAVGATRYEEIDHWDVDVNGKHVAKKIYTKDLPEGMFFMVIVEVKPGDIITFTYHNDSGTSKAVWFNYQFLKD